MTAGPVRCVWTVGHSTRSIEAFIELLQAHGIEAIADVRRFPGSRRLPQFGEQALRESLAAAGIDYLWIGELGGRRPTAPGATRRFAVTPITSPARNSPWACGACWNWPIAGPPR